MTLPEFSDSRQREIDYAVISSGRVPTFRLSTVEPKDDRTRKVFKKRGNENGASFLRRKRIWVDFWSICWTGRPRRSTSPIWNPYWAEVRNVAIILTLRDHETHAGTTLVYQTSEDVVLGNVFGIVKNLLDDAVLNPWLAEVTADTIPEVGRRRPPSFWDSPAVSPGHPRRLDHRRFGYELTPAVVFAEVKMDAGPSTGTRHSEKRSQLVRNLYIGYAQTQREGKAFAVVYVTLDATEPPEVAEIRRTERSFPNNPGVDPDDIWVRFHWCNWASVGKTVHQVLENGLLEGTEKKFALDLLAYLKKKGLWSDAVSTNLLAEVAGDKLYRVLDPTGTFIPHRLRQHQRDQTWRSGSWTDAELRAFLAGLSDEEKVRSSRRWQRLAGR